MSGWASSNEASPHEGKWCFGKGRCNLSFTRVVWRTKNEARVRCRKKVRLLNRQWAVLAVNP